MATKTVASGPVYYTIKGDTIMELFKVKAPATLPFEVGDTVTSTLNPILYRVLEITDTIVKIRVAECGAITHIVDRSKAAALLRRVHRYIVSATTSIYNEDGGLLIACNELITPELLLQMTALETVDAFLLLHRRDSIVQLVVEKGRVMVRDKE